MYSFDAVLSLSSVLLVAASGQQVDPSWNSGAGLVSLKAASNPSLCITAIPLNHKKSSAFLQLIDCSQEFSFYEGENKLEIDDISDGVYRFRTSINPVDASYPEYACFLTKGIENSIALTENFLKCDRSNTWQYWTFPEIGRNQYQLKHKNTGKCMRSPQISNGTTLRAVDCDVNDKNQIWDGQFLQHEWKWDGEGRVILRPVWDETLCMRTEQHDQQTSIINLAPCDKEYEVYQGNKRMELGKVQEGYSAIKTLHVPTGSSFGVFACLWTGFINGSKKNSPVVTDKCNYNNQWQYWKFIEISQTDFTDRIQLMHKETAMCIRATNDKTTVATADCDKNDIHQIWLREHV